MDAEVAERALTWVLKYRDEIRPLLVTPGLDPNEGSAPGLFGGTCGTLLLTHLGGPFTPNGLSNLVRHYIRQAELASGKPGSCHLLRHTMATLMLVGGADIRYIQAMLGHADLSTTQIYTQVSIRKLKEVHSRTHPARLRRSGRADVDGPDDADTIAQPPGSPGSRGSDATPPAPSLAGDWTPSAAGSICFVRAPSSFSRPSPSLAALPGHPLQPLQCEHGPGG